MNSNNYSYSAAGFPNNSLSLPNATFMESGSGSDLVLGTYGSNAIHFLVNGTSSTADALTISNAGLATFNNGIQASSTNPFIMNATTVSANYTIPTGYNATTAGKITINTGVTVTVSTGSRWVVV